MIKIFLFVFSDVYGYIEENDGIKYLVKKMMMNQLNTEKTSRKLCLNQTMIFSWVKHLIFLI